MGLNPSRSEEYMSPRAYSGNFVTNKMADKTCRLLDGKEASDFIASMDTFVFDCDGK